MEPGPPAGAVLLVSGLPLTAEEVEPLCADVRQLYPEFSTLHARRLALTNELLPRLSARARAMEAWENARRACAQALEQGEEPEGLRVEGTFRPLGVGLWSAARHLAPGEWSAPIELVGRWVRIRVEERSAAEDPLEERLVLTLLEFPYLGGVDVTAQVEAAIDAAHLSLIDAGFAEAVPEAWKHRMHATTP